MKNFVAPGKVLNLTAPAGGVTAGKGYKIGSLFVVAVADAAASAQFQGAAEGIYTLDKTAPEAWTEGAKLYWDNSGKKVTTTSSTNLFIGNAAKAADSADTEGDVRLNGAPA